MGVILAVLLVILAIYVAVLALNALRSGKYIGRDTAVQSTITVSGSGDVSTKPDLAVMDFSVVSEGKLVVTAMEDNTKKMNAIVDVAKSLGVAEADLQTTGYNISPRYDYVKQAASVLSPISTPASEGVSSSSAGSIGAAPAIDSVYYPNGKRTLSGYDVTQTLTVKMRDMTKIGQIIEEITAAGANQVGDLQFTLDNPDTVQAQAREKAITDAKSKAQVLAEQLGVRLVRITSYNDGGYTPVYRLNYAKAEAMDSAATGSAPAPTIQTGENKITVNVNITYEIE